MCDAGSLGQKSSEALITAERFALHKGNFVLGSGSKRKTGRIFNMNHGSHIADLIKWDKACLCLLIYKSRGMLIKSFTKVL